MSNGSPTSIDRVTRPSADATRQRIVTAAIDLFSERSFDGATTATSLRNPGSPNPF